MHTTPRFLQGVLRHEGAGLEKPAPLDPPMTYTVPDGAVGQPVYFRGGNSGSELVNVVLLRDGVAMRYFPVGARGDCHVPLAVVEDLEPGTLLELQVAAPEGAEGSLVLDLGLVEV